MFCPKCGVQLPDGSAFCAACGEKLAPVATPAAPAEQKSVQISVKMPPVATLVKLGIALVAFIFTFISWWNLAGYKSFNVLVGDIFEVSALLGIAKIFVIIDIVLFALYLISQFVDFNKFLNLPFNVKETVGKAYFAVYFAALLFCLIGIIATKWVGISFGWFIGFVFAGLGLVLEVKPDAFDGLIKKQ